MQDRVMAAFRSALWERSPVTPPRPPVWPRSTPHTHPAPASRPRAVVNVDMPAMRKLICTARRILILECDETLAAPAMAALHVATRPSGADADPGVSPTPNDVMAAGWETWCRSEEVRRRPRRRHPSLYHDEQWVRLTETEVQGTCVIPLQYTTPSVPPPSSSIRASEPEPTTRSVSVSFASSTQSTAPSESPAVPTTPETVRSPEASYRSVQDRTPTPARTSSVRGGRLGNRAAPSPVSSTSGSRANDTLVVEATDTDTNRGPDSVANGGIAATVPAGNGTTQTPLVDSNASPWFIPLERRTASADGSPAFPSPTADRSWMDRVLDTREPPLTAPVEQRTDPSHSSCPPAPPPSHDLLVWVSFPAQCNVQGRRILGTARSIPPSSSSVSGEDGSREGAPGTGGEETTLLESTRQYRIRQMASLVAALRDEKWEGQSPADVSILSRTILRPTLRDEVQAGTFASVRNENATYLVEHWRHLESVWVGHMFVDPFLFPPLGALPPAPGTADAVLLRFLRQVSNAAGQFVERWSGIVEEDGGRAWNDSDRTELWLDMCRTHHGMRNHGSRPVECLLERDSDDGGTTAQCFDLGMASYILYWMAMCFVQRHPPRLEPMPAATVRVHRSPPRMIRVTRPLPPRPIVVEDDEDSDDSDNQDAGHTPASDDDRDEDFTIPTFNRNREDHRPPVAVHRRSGGFGGGNPNGFDRFLHGGELSNAVGWSAWRRAGLGYDGEQGPVVVPQTNTNPSPNASSPRAENNRTALEDDPSPRRRSAHRRSRAEMDILDALEAAASRHPSPSSTPSPPGSAAPPGGTSAPVPVVVVEEPSGTPPPAFKRMRNETDTIAADVQEPPNACVVCRGVVSRVVLVPCGHLCMCGPCSLDLLRRTSRWSCPVCAKRITNAVHIYHAS